MSEYFKNFKVSEPEGKSGAVIISYGNYVIDTPYGYPENKPDINNKVDTKLPLKFYFDFVDDTRINGLRDISITLTTKESSPKIFNLVEPIKYFDLQVRSSEFAIIDWNLKLPANILNGLEFTLKCNFIVIGVYDGDSGYVNFEDKFSINGSAEHNENVDIIKIYSEANPLVYEFNLEEPEDVKEGYYEIVYGTPKGGDPANPNQIYRNNRPDENNNVGVMIPVKGSLNFPHGKFPKIAISRVISAVFTLTDVKSNYEKQYIPADNKWYTLTPGGYFFAFSIEDWKQPENAATFNSKEKLYLRAEIVLEVEINETPEQEEIKKFYINIAETTEGDLKHLVNTALFNIKERLALTPPINLNRVQAEVLNTIKRGKVLLNDNDNADRLFRLYGGR